MKVTINYSVDIDIDIPAEKAKEIHTAYLNGELFPDSVCDIIEATPEWQAIAKCADFELKGVYNLDCCNEDSEIFDEILWEE